MAKKTKYAVIDTQSQSAFVGVVTLITTSLEEAVEAWKKLKEGTVWIARKNEAVVGAKVPWDEPKGIYRHFTIEEHEMYKLIAYGPPKMNGLERYHLRRKVDNG